MVFNHFVRFVAEHRPAVGRVVLKQLAGVSIVVGLLLMLPLMFGVPLNVPFAALALTVLFTVVIHSVKLANRLALMPEVPPEISEEWQMLEWLLARRSLSERTHPELRDHLEAMANARFRARQALQSDTWQARRKSPDGRRVAEAIERTLNESLYDAIYIGRHLFRASGQREATFRRRIADPAFGRSALDAVAEIRASVEYLVDAAEQAGAGDLHRIESIQNRLNELVAAEREVEQDLGSIEDLA